jgi:hypothetical protein
MGWLSSHLCIWVQPGGLHVWCPWNWFIDFFYAKMHRILLNFVEFLACLLCLLQNSAKFSGIPCIFTYGISYALYGLTKFPPMHRVPHSYDCTIILCKA